MPPTARFTGSSAAWWSVVCLTARGATCCELVPWFWLLTRTADCRIFQNQTAVQIVQAIFDEMGFSDYQLKLSGSYTTREFCVQYRETDFQFISRLLEDEGIGYFFRHEDGKHTMVLIDDVGGLRRLRREPGGAYPDRRS